MSQPIVSESLGKYWGRRIRARREALGMTQVQVAQLAQLSQQAIAQYETGRFVPADNTKLRLARALGVAPGVLFEWPPLEQFQQGAA